MTKGIEISNMTSKTMNKEAKIEGFLNSLISEIKDRIIITSNVIHTFSAVEAKLLSIENRSKHTKFPEGKTLGITRFL